MRFLKYSVVPLFLLFASPLFGAELPLPIHLDVTGLTKAGPPRVVGNYVLFTYAPTSQVRFVGIAFQHENFDTVHTFYRNQHGIFFYLDPLPQTTTSIVYRLVVDGLWQPDPQNPDTETDQSGIVLSKVSIPPRHVQVTQSPVIHPDGMVQFFFKAPPGKTITIAGDFNNWDPFMDQLTKRVGNFYTISLRISPGTHGYYFVSNGTPISDPLNPRVDYAADGTKTSVFSVP